MEYQPQIGDYVIWERETWVGAIKDEGWVYFVGDVEEKKKGFPDNPRYITIETGVRPKPKCQYAKNDPHKMIHTLLLCYECDWPQLKYVKHRREEEQKATEDNMIANYKSQEGRYIDP